MNEVTRSYLVEMLERIERIYEDIRLDVIWQTIAQDLPSLRSQLEAILSSQIDRDS